MKLKYSAKAHGYWLDGKRCKSPSAVAKVPDDSSALDYWRRRQTAIGLALQPHLLTAVAAAANDKQQLDQLCEQAMEAAGANSGRDYGTSVHRITDLIDGGDFLLETPEVVEIRKRWRTLLAEHQLEVVATEQVVVHPDLMIAGRFDRVVRHLPTGDLLILDTKTGASAHQHLHAHAVQLWLYASAPLRADGPAGDNDFEVHDFVPMWPVRQDVALVAHLPQDGDATIVPINIAAGRHCFKHVIQPTWDWRNRSDLRADTWLERPLTARARNLLDRCKTIAEMDPAAAQNLRRNWPTGVAKLTEGGHDDDDLDRIEWIVGAIEAEIGAPLQPVRQELQPRPMPEPAAVVAKVAIDVDEGGEAPTGQMLLLRERYDALDDAGRSWIAQLTTEARDAGAPFHPSERKTLRTVRIVSGLIILAAAEADDADAVRALVCAAIGDDVALQPVLPLGAVVAMMSHVEAATFAALCDSLAAGRLQFSFDDGVMRVVDRVLSTDEVADLFGAAAV